MPAIRTSPRCAAIGSVGRLDRRHAAAGLAESHALEPQQQARRRRRADRATRGMASNGARAKVELTTRNSLMNIPSGGNPAIAKTPTTRPQPSSGWRHRQAADIGDRLGALDLRDMADGEEDRRLGEAVHDHVQKAGEIGERTADAEGEGDDPHVLDRRISEHPFDVAAPIQHEGGEDERDETEHRHQRTGRDRPGIGVEQQLEPQHRVERHVEQQTRQNRRNRRRAFGMGVGQPGVQRRQPDLGAVAQHQEHEGQIELRRIEGRARARSARSRPSHPALRRPPAGRPYRRGSCRTAQARCRRCRG